MFKYKTHGKWILAGEHSVLRGGEALVFPVKSRCLEFSFESADEMKLTIPEDHSDLEMAFWGVFEKALQKLNLSRKDISGHIQMDSNIPVGAGMGASATLCVSLARLFCDLGHLKEEDQYTFAKSLEDLFHGESSGVDVAVALNHKSLSFKKPQSMEMFEPVWQPMFYLSYCGKRGVTSDCIRKVQKLIESDQKLGDKLDSQMQESVALAKQALLKQNDIENLMTSIKLARNCFQQWGLIGNDLNLHMSFLEQEGAIATKPTGSGDGGFVLSLWNTKPDPSKFNFELIEA